MSQPTLNPEESANHVAWLDEDELNYTVFTGYQCEEIVAKDYAEGLDDNGGRYHVLVRDPDGVVTLWKVDVELFSTTVVRALAAEFNA